MALAESKNTEWQPGDIVTYTADTTPGAAPIYGGALVCITPTTGALIPASDVENLRFAGIALEPGAIGQRVRVRKTGIVSVGFGGSAGGAALADIGKTVYALADDSVGLDTDATHNIAVGVLVGVESGGAVVRVRIDGAVR